MVKKQKNNKLNKLKTLYEINRSLEYFRQF